MKKLLFLVSILFMNVLAYGQNTDVQNLIQEGIKLHDNGDYAKAIEKYKEALSIDPKSSLANYEISFSYLSSQDYKNAEKSAKKVIRLNNGNLLSAYISYGSALDMQGKTKKSIKVYEKAMKEYDNYLLYYNHAISCFNAEQLNKAYDSTIKAIKNKSSHASSHLLLSKIMNKQGFRIKAMLSLYFFLLLEPNSERSVTEYKTLRNYLKQGLSQSSDENINIKLPLPEDSDFGTAEMLISLSIASDSLYENKNDVQLFAKNNDAIFKMLGELKKENSGFWWDFYVSFFYEMAKKDFTEVYSYYISISQSDNIAQWFDEHNEDFERFRAWVNQ